MIIKDQNFIKDESTIRHGFFTRKGGVSDGIFKSLNCGPGSGDDLFLVTENRTCVAEEMGVPPEYLMTMQQNHTPKCLYVTEPFGDNRPEGDAMVTDEPDLLIGVLTADCAPVLLTGAKENQKPVIGAAHAGWKGAVGGVLENTVAGMLEAGAVKDTLRASIGPCIGPKSYEVSIEFAAPFFQQDEENAHFFKESSREGHLMFDLPGYCARRLALCGVKHVSITGMDTYADEQHFFSFRRATHRGQSQYGRQISCLVIKD